MLKSWCLARTFWLILDTTKIYCFKVFLFYQEVFVHSMNSYLFYGMAWNLYFCFAKVILESFKVYSLFSYQCSFVVFSNFHRLSHLYVVVNNFFHFFDFYLKQIASSNHLVVPQTRQLDYVITCSCVCQQLFLFYFSMPQKSLSFALELYITINIYPCQPLFSHFFPCLFRIFYRINRCCVIASFTPQYLFIFSFHFSKKIF